jgi:hypothetical protein
MNKPATVFLIWFFPSSCGSDSASPATQWLLVKQLNGAAFLGPAQGIRHTAKGRGGHSRGLPGFAAKRRLTERP